VEIGATTWGRAAWTALAQIPADALGLDIEVSIQVWRVETAGCRHRWRLSPYRDCGACHSQCRRAVIAKLADLATAMSAHPCSERACRRDGPRRVAVSPR